MKVLVLSRYVARGASSRLRMLQYLPVFAGYGWACAESPLLDEAYLAAVYALSLIHISEPTRPY